MIAVDAPVLFNAQCLVTRRSDPERGPYVDLLRDFDIDHRGRMYISRVAVQEMARTLGLITGEEQQLREENERLQAELEDVRAELESLQEFERSANYTLEHFGQKVRKKPGRKPKETVSA